LRLSGLSILHYTLGRSKSAIFSIPLLKQRYDIVGTPPHKQGSI
jgi:hypothetical protein